MFKNFQKNYKKLCLKRDWKVFAFSLESPSPTD